MINTPNIENIVRIYGIALNNLGASLPLPYSSTGSVEANIEVDAGTQTINISARMDRSEYNGYITIEYTKTTD